MATTTQFVWDEAKQQKVPVVTVHQVSSEASNLEAEASNEAEAPATAEQQLAPEEQIAALKAELAAIKGEAKRRGRVAAFDPGPTAVSVTTKVSKEWLDKLQAKMDTKNKSYALFMAVQAAIEIDQ